MVLEIPPEGFLEDPARDFVSRIAIVEKPGNSTYLDFRGAKEILVRYHEPRLALSEGER